MSHREGGLRFSVFFKTLDFWLLMGLNITVCIQTPTYTGHCNCNDFIWFTWKWNPWLLTAMNSPLSRISQPAQSDTLKYTSIMNISHLETNTTESMGSLYMLGTAQWLKQLPQPYFFQPVSPHPFHAIIINQINVVYTSLNSLKTIEFMKILEI